MDLTGISALSSAASTASASASASLLVLRKALDLESEGALQLLEAAVASSNPAHLGQSVDVRA